MVRVVGVGCMGSPFGLRGGSSRLDQEPERIRSHADFGPASDSADIADGWEGRLESIYLVFFSCRSVRPLYGGDVELSRNSSRRRRRGRERQTRLEGR